ncbi:phospholipase/carboxylesterase [Microbacteriaceae bacterium SG_E_30_P1]|uniref:Phospholipase/carboxylesterase n=1 Tax=Antiquaquibacter oligotrophicus TaxID=2880260 RepID=A0ABT6KJ15_9MICO|nr:alpha/beta fold hydrolase [Antiquaquibacter oligotrophicus]MDH6179866.1 phospholipase/carboxylesterase [Antiquaquibacter oligotrophicus]UDF14373.1 alpha/beta fold hydrolase [Antiquaquibacter oligotrophicus]
MNLDTSAVLWSAPERERAGRDLLVLLHGYGSHEGDLFSLSPALPLGAVVASVRAPLRESGGFAWWSLEGATPGAPDPVAVDEATDAVLAWLDTLEYRSVSILGFSQGGAMTLQLLRHAPTRFAAAVCLSGFVATASHPGDTELARVKPRVFWGRGTTDEVIPDAAIARTAEWLPAHATADVHVYEGLGHSISTEELTDFARFLAPQR